MRQLLVFPTRLPWLRSQLARDYLVTTPVQSEDELGAVVQLNASLEKMISAKEVQINVYLNRSTP